MYLFIHYSRPNLSVESRVWKKSKQVALCFSSDKQSRLFRKTSLRPPQNKCSPHWNCNPILRFSTAYHTCNCVAQLNFHFHFYSFFRVGLRPRPKSQLPSMTIHLCYHNNIFVVTSYRRHVLEPKCRQAAAVVAVEGPTQEHVTELNHDR